MAQLQIPLSIWLGATPEERDGFYLAAGFDPNLPVIDNGTDSMTLRFRQDVPVPTAVPTSVNGLQENLERADIPAPQAATSEPQAGDDLRDFVVPSAVPAEMAPLTALDVGVVPVAGGVIGSTALATRIAVPLRPAFATWLAGVAGIPKVAFPQLPSWLQRAMGVVGIGAAAVVIESLTPNIDIPFVPAAGDFLAPAFQQGVNMGRVDIQIGGRIAYGSHLQHGAEVVGSWNTNPKHPEDGVTFYRLMDGKLAVQNKKGRWKVWRPKKPIVLFNDGAKDIKTMVRADKALNKQAKDIAKVLNKRAPKPRPPKKDAAPAIIVQGSGRVIDT